MKPARARLPWRPVPPFAGLPHAVAARRGFILILVLVIVMLASMVAASLLYMLGAEQRASTATISIEQSRAVAMSGIYQAMKIVAATEPGSLDWQDNPGAFRDQLVLDDGSVKWYFSVYSVCETSDTEASGIRFGLTDEASKLPIQRADEAMLGGLPNMTATVAQAILGFLNPNESAASTHPTDLEPTSVAVAIPRHELTCLDDLLHIGGCTARVLYGEDANLNGRLDPNEDDGDLTFPPDNQDGKLDLGLRQYVTVSSYDLNVDSEGKPRLNLNDPTADVSALNLPSSVLAYLEALRQNKRVLGHPVELLEASDTFTNQAGKQAQLSSGVGKEELAVLLDHCTATNQARLTGLVNVSTASAAVLARLPGLDQTTAEAIVSARTGLSAGSQKTPAWLYQEGLLDADRFKKVAPWLTARSYQYRFQVLAYPIPAGHWCILDAVIDLAAQPPLILSLRDISKVGLPFPVSGPDQSGPPPASGLAVSGSRRPAGGLAQPGMLAKRRALIGESAWMRP